MRLVMLGQITEANMNPFFNVIAKKIAGGGGGGGTPDLLDEGFEGTGPPSGWASATGTGNYDYSSSPLAGSQSFRAPASSAARYNSGGLINHSEVWGKCLLRIDTLPTAAQVFLNMGEEFVAFGIYIFLDTNGTILCNDGASVFSANTVSAMSTATVYNLWWHYKKSPGGFNGIIEASFDVAGNPRPNSGNKWTGASGSGTGSGSTGTVNFLEIGWTSNIGNDAVTVWDSVQVSSTDIF